MRRSPRRRPRETGRRLSDPLVVARGVAKRFGALSALEDVCFELHAGSLLALVGPNGAGKSTLLRLLSGLARPSAGDVSIGGHPAHAARARALVGLVSHATHLHGALTARENLVFVARLYGVDVAGGRIETLLEMVGLTSVADRVARSFSRGMAQRLAIARGLVHEPEVVLLDEPFTGLDPAGSERLGARFCALRDGGCAVILVTHDVSRLSTLADRALVLRRGRIVHDASGPDLDAAALQAAFERPPGEAG